MSKRNSKVNVLGNVNMPFGKPMKINALSVTMLLYHDKGLYKAALTVMLITGGK